MPKQCSTRSKHHGNTSYICNPETGRYVKRNGPTGRRLLNKNKKDCSTRSKHHGNAQYICNPETGRYVKRNGPTGRRLSKVKSPVRYKKMKGALQYQIKSHPRLYRKRRSIKKMTPRLQKDIKQGYKLQKSYKRAKKLPVNIQRLIRRPPRKLKPLPKYHKLSPRLSEDIKKQHKLRSIKDDYQDLVMKVNQAFAEYSAEQDPNKRRKKQGKYNRLVMRLRNLQG